MNGLLCQDFGAAHRADNLTLAPPPPANHSGAADDGGGSDSDGPQAELHLFLRVLWLCSVAVLACLLLATAYFVRYLPRRSVPPLAAGDAAVQAERVNRDPTPTDLGYE